MIFHYFFSLLKEHDKRQLSREFPGIFRQVLALKKREVPLNLESESLHLSLIKTLPLNGINIPVHCNTRVGSLFFSF